MKPSKHTTNISALATTLLTAIFLFQTTTALPHNSPHQHLTRTHLYPTSLVSKRDPRLLPFSFSFPFLSNEEDQQQHDATTGSAAGTCSAVAAAANSPGTTALCAAEQDGYVGRAGGGVRRRGVVVAHDLPTAPESIVGGGGGAARVTATATVTVTAFVEPTATGNAAASTAGREGGLQAVEVSGPDGAVNVAVPAGGAASAAGGVGGAGGDAKEGGIKLLKPLSVQYDGDDDERQSEEEEEEEGMRVRKRMAVLGRKGMRRPRAGGATGGATDGGAGGGKENVRGKGEV